MYDVVLVELLVITELWHLRCFVCQAGNAGRQCISRTAEFVDPSRGAVPIAVHWPLVQFDAPGVYHISLFRICNPVLSHAVRTCYTVARSTRYVKSSFLVASTRIHCIPLTGAMNKSVYRMI
jgi:hypothetical protein